MDAKLDRLVRMVGNDEGFYVLALHSFVEWYLRKVKGYGDEPAFGDLTWQLRIQRDKPRSVREPWFTSA